MRNLGRREVLDRINKILQENAPNVHKDMGMIEIPIQIPNSVIDAEYEQIVATGDFEDALDIFALKCVPDNTFVEKYTDALYDKSSILGLFNMFYFNTEGNLAHYVKPGEENKSEQEQQVYSKMLELLTIVTHLLIEKGKEEGLFTVDNVMNYISKSKVINDKRLNIIEKGVYSYFNNDYISSISILIPQIEWMTRKMYLALDYVVTDSDEIGTKSDALGTLLSNDEIKFFDKDITRYLRTILADRTGWNLRNLYCHGISDAFNIPHADRVFHILLFKQFISREPAYKA